MSQLPSADMLDDIAVRFILSLPASELESSERLLFCIETAWWHYEDVVRDLPENRGRLKSLHLKEFAGLLLDACPGLREMSSSIEEMYEAFNRYKREVPVRGCILLDPTRQRCLLVRGWRAGSSWGFPRGKLAASETDAECAAREVLEETGLDVLSRIREDASISARLPTWNDNPKDKEGGKDAGPKDTGAKDASAKDAGGKKGGKKKGTGAQGGEGQGGASGLGGAAASLRPAMGSVKLYIVDGVPESTPLAPTVKYEIGAYAWHAVNELPTTAADGKATFLDAEGKRVRYNHVWPFAKQLKAWIAKRNKADAHAARSQQPEAAPAQILGHVGRQGEEATVPAPVPARGLTSPESQPSAPASVAALAPASAPAPPFSSLGHAAEPPSASTSEAEYQALQHAIASVPSPRASARASAPSLPPHLRLRPPATTLEPPRAPLGDFTASPRAGGDAFARLPSSLDAQLQDERAASLSEILRPALSNEPSFVRVSSTGRHQSLFPDGLPTQLGSGSYSPRATDPSTSRLGAAPLEAGLSTESHATASLAGFRFDRAAILRAFDEAAEVRFALPLGLLPSGLA